jgi:F0F1-type ATP synthase delta subunit
VVTAVNEILNQLLNNPKLDITSLENLINKINLTITKQNETKELWNVQVTNDNQMDITDVVKFTGDLNENFENYYNSEL